MKPEKTDRSKGLFQYFLDDGKHSWTNSHPTNDCFNCNPFQPRSSLAHLSHHIASKIMFPATFFASWLNIQQRARHFNPMKCKLLVDEGMQLIEIECSKGVSKGSTKFEDYYQVLLDNINCLMGWCKRPFLSASLRPPKFPQQRPKMRRRTGVFNLAEAPHHLQIASHVHTAVMLMAHQHLRRGPKTQLY